MRLADYFRSTPFRIATTYASLFILSVVILFCVVYWLTSEEIRGELRSNIDQDIGSLMAVYRERGAIGLRADIEDRIADVRGNDSLYIYRIGTGDFVSNKMLNGDPIVGWQSVTIGKTSGDQPNEPALNTFLSRGVQVDDAFFLVGRRLRGLTEVQEVLLRSLAWAMGLTAMMALAGGVSLSHGALQRIEAINNTFREIMDGNLSRRVQTKGKHDDLDRLSDNINHMLNRIEQLMANLQQVTNDIAHDLRTPLGRLRQGLESARLKESNVEAYQMAIDQAIEQTDTILETFAALLRIAQIESNVRRSHFTVADLSEISNRIIEAYASVVEDAGQTLTGNIDSNVQVRGDKDLLTQMLSNLVENASQHCPMGTKIIVTLTNDPTPQLTVADTGPGIRTDAREAVLRRFHRLEDSRTTPGSGLGLALVKAIADLHGATLTLSDNQPGLCVRLLFPNSIRS